MAANYGLRGEVAIVDLGEGRYIFAYPLASGDLLYAAAPERYPGLSIGDRVEWLPMAIENRDPIALEERRYPRFVTFGDISDPLTADTFEADEMAVTFGDGYEITSVTVQVVDEPVVSGRVDRILAWRCDYLNPYRRLDGRTGPIYGNDAVERLGPGYFSTENCG